jgi:hypothetical protein
MHLQLLEVIQKETNRLNQIRGVWNAPSTHRDWNDLKAVGKEQAPLAIEAYRSEQILPQRYFAFKTTHTPLNSYPTSSPKISKVPNCEGEGRYI